MSFAILSETRPLLTRNVANEWPKSCGCIIASGWPSSFVTRLVSAVAMLDHDRATHYGCASIATVPLDARPFAHVPAFLLRA
jgi:hypothetical protein